MIDDRRCRSRMTHHAVHATTRGILRICLLQFIASVVTVHALSYDPSSRSGQTTNNGGEEESKDSVFEQMKNEIYAVLFPWFVQFIGIAAYYVLSRYAHVIPATAVMFIVGALIGFAVPRVPENGITSSASTWIGMEGKVLLLVFLPGLLFLDSYKMDFHLFIMTFWQVVILAFPMVLAGTVLTALVANYMFDFGWSFDLCMTFGSILSATDPVAIAVLLNELGAPARLQVSF